MEGHNSSTGRPIASKKRFPSGMQALADYIHRLSIIFVGNVKAHFVLSNYIRVDIVFTSRGLKFGIYRDRRRDFGFEQQDADQFAEWGADYVKNDGYGYDDRHNLTSSQVYATFRDAANRTGTVIQVFRIRLISYLISGRPMALNIKFDIQPEGFEEGPELANSWRVGRDIRPVWADVVRTADIASAIGRRSSFFVVWISFSIDLSSYE